MNLISYPKINSIYKRDDEGRFTKEFADPVFDYLYDNDWVATEKIDGTNIRIGWDGENVIFGGRTDKAKMPPLLQEYLTATFTPSRMSTCHPMTILFGEGYGHKIQGVGNRYHPSEVRFILFDVWCGGWWLRDDSVTDVASQLGIERAPLVAVGPLSLMEQKVQDGFCSHVSEDVSLPAEGLVCRPLVSMLFRTGQPVITKIKTRDYK
jgi:hypothetical protein